MRFLTTAAGCIVLAACATSGPDPAALMWRELRLDSTATVASSDRWRVPRGAGLHVASMAGAPPAGWHDAAVQGLARRFQVTTATDAWRLELHWPERRDPCAAVGADVFDGACRPDDAPAPVSERRVDVVLLGLDRRPAERGLVQARVLDPSGRLVTEAALHLTPRWFGASWREPAQLEQAFALLADHLASDLAAARLR